MRKTPLNCPCGAQDFSKVFNYDAPPEGENIFRFSSTGRYRREIHRCGICGHFISSHEMDDTVLYSGDYLSSTYGGPGGMKKAFEQILSLPPEKSDNSGRVERVVRFASSYFSEGRFRRRKPLLLDVGSGLCVFPFKMKEAGFACKAIDTDVRLVEHAKKVAHVEAVQMDFRGESDLGRFDIITFNKVLEHVQNPVAMLAKSKDYLVDGGFVHVELPDGEAAAKDGFGREEFFIDHLHVFSFASISLLVERAGFVVKTVERLKEPSGKHTLRAFMTCADITAR